MVVYPEILKLVQNFIAKHGDDPEKLLTIFATALQFQAEKNQEIRR